MIEFDILPIAAYEIALGIPLTLAFTLVGLLGGLIIGLVLALSQMSSRLLFRYCGAVYLSVFRGTPLLLQLALVYFALPQLLGITLSAWAAGMIAFALNSAAYIAETLRAGLQSIDKGQFEAAAALHIPPLYLYRDIILPQAVRNILPALVNEWISLLKETALISSIGGLDMMRRANVFASEYYLYFEPLCVAALYYYAIIMFFTYLGKKCEQRFSYGK